MQQNEREIFEKLGKIVKKLREQRRISLNIFSFENDIQKSLVSRIENGCNEPKLISLWKIAEGLNIKLSAIIQMLENELGEDFTLSQDSKDIH